jgi:hypothetical protein
LDNKIHQHLQENFKRTSTAIFMAWTWLDVQAFGIAWDIAKSKKLK